ncbi:MAG: hypothetical protein INH41_31380 [Myxococcaceae bacterium]|nr:hypothetical protein [Myxococcaceae bacterium]MCA3016910.1 hypothetical protein [Myxococcaceae bacterium]
MTLRWAFPDPREAAERAAVDARIDAWWQALAGARERLTEGAFELSGLCERHLLAIHPALRWELRQGARARWRFVVTAGDDRHLEPLVSRVVVRAPGDLGLEVAPWREAEPLHAALATVRARFGVDASDWTVEFGPPQLGFVQARWRGASDPDAAVCLMNGLVGERAVMDWVGPVEVARPSLRAKLFRGSGTGVGSFAAAFVEQQRALLARRPARPLQARDDEGSWAVVSFDPTAAREGRLRDLTSAATPDLELLQVVVSGAPFASARFSRFGEAFLYAQVEVPPDEGTRRRMQLEDALDAALAGSGRVVTAGTGARFAYIVLVVAELAPAVERVRATLERLGVPRRAWVRFLDDGLSAEWVGVFPDSPPPSD